MSVTGVAPSVYSSAGKEAMMGDNLEGLAKAIFLAHHRYRFDLGESLPEWERARPLPRFSIAEVEAGGGTLEDMWARMHWKDREPFRYYARAALTWLGLDPDNPPSAGAWKTVREALKAPTHDRNDYNCEDWPPGEGCAGCRGDELRADTLRLLGGEGGGGE